MVERSVAVYTVIKLGGSFYLIYLRIKAFRQRKALSEAMHGEVKVTTSRKVLREGFIVGVTNPKAIVFFVAVLPAFTDRDAGHLPLQLLILGAIFAGLAIIFDSTWALLASHARDWFASSPKRVEAIGGTGGLMIVGLGTTLALTGNRH